jgi:hypothetical protein
MDGDRSQGKQAPLSSSVGFGRTPLPSTRTRRFPQKG